MSSSNLKTTITELSKPEVLNEEDSVLVSSFEINSSFNPITDRVDIFVYSVSSILNEQGILTGQPDDLITFVTNNTNYKVVRQGSTEISSISTIELNVEQDLLDVGLEGSDAIFIYRFNRNLLTDKADSTPTFFIKEISEDRTELKCYSVSVSDETILRIASELKDKFSRLPYIDNIVIDFGSNLKAKIINVGTFIENEKVYLLLKLYEPLDQEFNEKSEFELIEEVSDSLSYLITSEFLFQEPVFPTLKGPNFNIDALDSFSNPTEFKNKEEILLLFTGSNYQTYSILGESSVEISIDHSSYENFVHFSSAEERIKNFKYKLGKIQEYQNYIVSASNLNQSISTGSISNYENLINSILQNFDHYDRFLYYESGSSSWPKVSSSYPYVNQSTSSTESLIWYQNTLLSASYYDSYNPHRLLNTIPTYLKDDEANLPYNVFVDMIGEFFDNQWIYAKAVTDRYDNDNRLNYGISRDLVADALRSFGVRIYGNDLNFENLFSVFTGNFYVTGSEQISTFVSASNVPTPIKNYQQEIYKRLYHNIPLLLKSKGTERAIRALINSYGIPKDFLNIRLYGGNNADNPPFFGDNFSVTSSLDKIRLDNTGSVLEGDTLSFHTSITSKPKKYSQDIHTVEIGFSPSDNINNFLVSSSVITGSFDIDNYIGDPRYAYTPKYNNLYNYAKSTFSGSINTRYNLYDYIRLIKFYDNTLFKIIKDFVPGRTNVNTGVIIKPHILERNKIKQVEPKWSKQFVTTGSVLDFVGNDYEKNFVYEGTIDLIKTSGGSGGSFGSGSTSGSYSGFTFFKEYDTRYSYLVKLPTFTSGTVQTHDESKYNGEFAELINKNDGKPTYTPQSTYITDGELNSENKFKKTNLKPYYYLLRALQVIED